MPIPLSVEVIAGVLAKCLIPLSGEVIVIVSSLLCRDGVIGERSCVLLVCICQILSGGSPVWEVLCGCIVKILLCEGGDVEQWLEPRNISRYLRLIYYL